MSMDLNDMRAVSLNQANNDLMKQLGGEGSERVELTQQVTRSRMWDNGQTFAFTPPATSKLTKDRVELMQKQLPPGSRIEHKDRPNGPPAVLVHLRDREAVVAMEAMTQVFAEADKAGRPVDEKDLEQAIEKAQAADKPPSDMNVKSVMAPVPTPTPDRARAATTVAPTPTAPPPTPATTKPQKPARTLRAPGTTVAPASTRAPASATTVAPPSTAPAAPQGPATTLASTPAAPKSAPAPQAPATTLASTSTAPKSVPAPQAPAPTNKAKPEKPAPEKPAPEKPTNKAKPEKPTPEKPTPGKPTPEKSKPHSGESADSKKGHDIETLIQKLLEMLFKGLSKATPGNALKFVVATVKAPFKVLAGVVSDTASVVAKPLQVIGKKRTIGGITVWPGNKAMLNAGNKLDNAAGFLVGQEKRHEPSSPTPKPGPKPAPQPEKPSPQGGRLGDVSKTLGKQKNASEPKPIDEKMLPMRKSDIEATNTCPNPPPARPAPAPAPEPEPEVTTRKRQGPGP
jgi:hypothetical protein